MLLSVAAPGLAVRKKKKGWPSAALVAINFLLAKFKLTLLSAQGCQNLGNTELWKRKLVARPGSQYTFISCWKVGSRRS